MAISSIIDRHLDDEDMNTIPEDLVVSTGDSPRLLQDDNMKMEFSDSVDNPDEGVTVTFGDDGNASTPDENELDHDANLAVFISDTDNLLIADELIDMISADRDSMSPWRDKLKHGLEIMGVVSSSADELPFDGASAVVHPLISEAVVQFNARSGAELLPPAGPCKGLVVGKSTLEKRKQADRMEGHMNWQMTIEDSGYYEEIDSLLFYLPFAGSGFTKTYYDDLHFHTTTRFIKAEHVVIPYTATSLENSTRYSIMEKINKNDVRKRMATGLYRDIQLIDPVLMDDDDLKGLYDEVDGRESRVYEDDPQHEIAEVNIEYNLPGFEDADGIALPYLITVDTTSRNILSIRRNWKVDDPQRKRRHYLTHYKYLPGMGFMGMGLLHVMGGLAEACTGSMRALLDSAAFATLQGGFKAKEAKFPAGEHVMRPGTWEDVDLSMEELQRAFYTPPFKEPSQALFQMLKLLEDNGRRFAGTTEAVVGDAATSGPVGTTVALIEQGTKIMSGIHKRIHRAQRREFTVRADINAEFIPQGQELYYDKANESSYITGDDYMNNRVNVVPVSDPNITSAAQRIAKAQALQQRADARPDLYRAHLVEYRMLEALDVDDAEKYIRDPDKKHRCDAIGEGSRIMSGLPIFAYQDQVHADHINIHLAQIEYLKTLPEDKGGPLIMQMTDHIAKHEAYRVYVQADSLMGGQLPDIDLYAEDPEEEMPAEIERHVTEQSAQFVSAMMQEIQANKPPPPEDAKTQAEIARDDAEHKQKMAQSDEDHQQEMRHKEENFVQKQQQERDNSDPNSAQEKMMAVLQQQQQAIQTLTAIVMPLVNGIIPKGQPNQVPPTKDNTDVTNPIPPSS